jgi:hypothetical protein
MALFADACHAQLLPTVVLAVRVSPIGLDSLYIIYHLLSFSRIFLLVSLPLSGANKIPTIIPTAAPANSPGRKLLFMCSSTYLRANILSIKYYLSFSQKGKNKTISYE